MIAVRLLSRSLPCAPVFRNSRLPLTVSLDAKNVSERGEGRDVVLRPASTASVRALEGHVSLFVARKKKSALLLVAPLHSLRLPHLNYILEIVFGLKYSPAPGEWANGRGAGTVSLTSHNGRAMPAAGRRPLSARACLIYLTTHSGRSA